MRSKEIWSKISKRKEKENEMITEIISSYEMYEKLVYYIISLCFFWWNAFHSEKWVHNTRDEFIGRRAVAKQNRQKPSSLRQMNWIERSGMESKKSDFLFLLKVLKFHEYSHRQTPLFISGESQTAGEYTSQFQ